MVNYNVPFHWRRYKERYRLLGTKCDNCGQKFFPSRNICPKCRRKGRIETINFSGKGKVYSYTIVRVPPTGFEAYTPYALGLIELDEGPKLTSQIVDCKFEDIYIDMPVEVCFRKLTSQDEEGIICYGFKFKPIH